MSLLWLLVAVAPALAELVVTEARPTFGAAVAGIEVDETLLSWRTLDLDPPQKGRFESWTDLHALETRLAPLTRVEVRVRRGLVTRTVTLPRAQWSLAARPPLSAAVARRAQTIGEEIATAVSDPEAVSESSATSSGC